MDPTKNKVVLYAIIAAVIVAVAAVVILNPGKGNVKGAATYNYTNATYTNATTCTDSDGGKKYDVKGTVNFASATATSTPSDACVDAIINGVMVSNVLREYYCDSNKQVQYVHYQCPTGCQNGACMATTCKDSDGGKKYDVKGTATGGDANGYSSLTDSCAGGGGADIRMLAEAYCSGNTILEENYICPNGCSNGACIAPCTDSDGGKNYYVKGTATGNENGQRVTSTDGCRSDSKTLAEVYCNGTDLKVDQYVCQYACTNGACMKAPPVNGICGNTTNTCARGTFSDVADTTTAYLWKCAGSNGGTTASCSAPRTASVNGVCGFNTNSCAKGTFQDVMDSISFYLWKCVGSNGGTTASCSAPKSVPVPVNGICGNTTNSCAKGTFSDVPDSMIASLWKCVGKNGGTTASCSVLM